MKGTEKQIKWAEDIKAEYLAMMDKEIEWLHTVIETGSAKAEKDTMAATFVSVYHPTAVFNTVRTEMRSTDLFEAYMATKSGTPERKAAAKAYRVAVAEEALRRLEKEVSEKAAEESAAKWIESRMR